METKKTENKQHTNRINMLKNTINQYDKIISELETKENYWELKQYTSLWHYRDGMKIALFIMTHQGM